MKKLHIKKRYIVIAILLILWITVYLFFVTTRYSGYTTYIPFTGRVFRVNSEEIEMVRIISGTTSTIVDFQDDGEIKEWVQYLNSFRYRYWVPELPGERSGFSYALLLYTDGERFYHEFNDNSIEVNGVWFVGSREYFSRLTSAVAG